MPSKSYKLLAEGYIEDVLNGDITASEMVKAACQRHLDDLKHAGDRGYVFDEQIAEGYCQLISMLTQTQGEYAGEPFDLKPFQAFIVWVGFGWRVASTKLRRFQEFYISMARGNGKSAFGAALLLVVFAFDIPVEPRAECYTVATKEDQASIVWSDVRAFVDKDPDLQAIVKRLKKNLSIPETDSFCVPLGSDSNVTDGLRPHCIVADEVHAWRKHHAELWAKLVTAMGKRRQPLLIVITTAGTDDSILWIQLDDLARMVVDRDNAFEDDLKFVFIAELDKDDDLFDERKWPKAHPMLACDDEKPVVKVAAVRKFANEAKVKPEKKSDFERFYANRRASAADQLISSKRWAKGNRPLPPLNGLEGHAGFDWGFRNDLTALAHVFPLDTVEIGGDTKRRYAIDVDVWVPDGCPYDLGSQPWAGFIERGELEVTIGETTDTAAIYDRLDERQDRHGIRTIAMDGNNAREFGTKCTNDYGLDAFYFGQTCARYNEPLMELLTALDEGRIIHGGNTLLAWCATKLVAIQNQQGYRMPAKNKTIHKIDPIVAVIMALSECMFAEGEGVSDEYDKPGSFLL